MSSLRSALGLLTIFGGSAPLDRRAPRWFPLVGALVGATVAAVWWASAQMWPILVAGALAVLADLLATGLLHVDGLADSADGLLAPMSRERRLEVMSAPDTGAFGVATVAATLLVEVACLGSVDPSGGDLAGVVAVWCATRLVCTLALARLPPARTEGLGASHSGGTVGLAALTAAVVIGATAAASAQAAAAALVAALAARAVIGLGRRRLGGHTGDVLGAAIVVGQAAGLLAVTWG